MRIVPTWVFVSPERRLNPCFRGSYSMSEIKSIHGDVLFSLNPCFRGSYSMSFWL